MKLKNATKRDPFKIESNVRSALDRLRSSRLRCSRLLSSKKSFVNRCVEYQLILEMPDCFLLYINSICNYTEFKSQKFISIHCIFDIYDNYANKLEKRYANYDYSFYENSKKIYTELLEKLKNYEKSGLQRVFKN